MSEELGVSVRLSIVIPIYNVEKYLKKCLDSVIYPSLADYEIILVNDGSTDGSGVIAAEYARRYAGLVKLITTPNGGLGAARNVGMHTAVGEYIVFLDSDDYLTENAVPEMMDVLDEGFDICFYDLVSVNEDGEEIGHIRGSGKEGEFTLESNPGLLMESPCACNKIFRRELFVKNGIEFLGRVWYEDLRCIPKLYPYAKKMIYRGDRWYMYLQRSGSITNSSDAVRNLEILDAVSDLTAFYRERGLLEKYREEFEFIAFQHGLLSSSVRVNTIGAGRPEQDVLLETFLREHPDYRSFAFFKNLRFSHRLIHFLIVHKLRRTLHLFILANNFIKRKKL